MALKFNQTYLMKGTLYALILMIGTGVGVFLRVLGSNFYVILAIVSIINILATIIVFRFLKQDLFLKEEERKESSKTNKNATKSDKTKV